MRVGLAAYSAAYSMGFMEPHERAWGADGLIDAAVRLGLSGVELPANLVSRELDAGALSDFADKARDAGLSVVADTGGTDPERLSENLRAAGPLGATLLRTTLSSILEGERGRMEGGWRAHLEACIENLKQVRPLAEDLGVTLAVENHQDVTSYELIELCERVGGDRIGVTLDAGNPLAVGEMPEDFLKRVAPFLKNVHWKDYTISRIERGFCLQRCALGDGDLDFPALFALADELAPGACASIELAAHAARNVRVLDEDWWETFEGLPHRESREILETYPKLARGDAADWRSHWERGVRGEQMWRAEQDELERSVAYLKEQGLGIGG